MKTRFHFMTNADRGRSDDVHMAWSFVEVNSREDARLVAALLGDAGYRFLVLDRARFPSDTLSTHFFRAPTFRALGQVGVYEEVQAKAPHLTVNYNAVDGIVFPEAVDRPEDYPFFLCVRGITPDTIPVRRG